MKKERELKPPTILNKRLKETRESLGLSQRAVVQALNLKDNKLISWYEKTGAMPPYEKLIKLAKLYGVSLDYLFGLEDYIEENYTIFKVGESSILTNADAETLSYANIRQSVKDRRLLMIIKYLMCHQEKLNALIELLGVDITKGE